MLLLPEARAQPVPLAQQELPEPMALLVAHPLLQQLVLELVAVVSLLLLLNQSLALVPSFQEAQMVQLEVRQQRGQAQQMDLMVLMVLRVLQALQLPLLTFRIMYSIMHPIAQEMDLMVHTHMLGHQLCRVTIWVMHWVFTPTDGG
jgi:hypothetical protein